MKNIYKFSLIGTNHTLHIVDITVFIVFFIFYLETVWKCDVNTILSDQT